MSEEFSRLTTYSYVAETDQTDNATEPDKCVICPDPHQKLLRTAIHNLCNGIDTNKLISLQSIIDSDVNSKNIDPDMATILAHHLLNHSSKSTICTR